MSTPTPPRPHVLQRDRILRLAHVNSDTGFTRREAAMTVGCYELASRIGELEAEGVVFEREREVTQNAFGDPVRYTRYRLKSAPTHVLHRAGIPQGGGP